MNATSAWLLNINVLVKTGKGKMPEFIVTINSSKEKLAGKKTKDGLEFQLAGNSESLINWKA